MSEEPPSLPPLPPKRKGVKPERHIGRKPNSANERRKLEAEIRRQKAKEAELAEQKKADKLEKTKKRIEEEVRDEKFLERQALHYINKEKKILASDVMESAPPELVEELKKQDVAFKPNSDKQVAFLSASEDHVLFGGGRAGGKTEAFIADPLAYVENPNFRALVIRRTIPDLRDLIQRAKVIYQKICPTVQWKVKETLFTFPSGATIEYGYLDSASDLDKYHGQQYTWMGIDEISQLPEYTWFSKLLGSLRSTDPTLRAYLRATTNWTGVGASWVKEYFHVDNAPPNTTVYEYGEINFNGTTIKTTLTKKWINSTIFDNPAKRDDISYLAFLNSQPEYLKKAWLYGETTAIEGAAFPEFQRGIHVCEPFDIPHDWLRIRGADYGYGDGAACIWLAVSPERIHYAYRELVVNSKSTAPEKRLDAPTFARKVRELESDEYVRYGVLDSSVWANRGDAGPSLAEQMIKEGTRWRPADKSKGSRAAGKNKIHQLLQVNEMTKKPSLIFFDNCMQCIKMMNGIPLDSDNAEDVDTDSPLDHQYDALRYVLMSRPFVAHAQWNSTPPRPINSTFGY